MDFDLPNTLTFYLLEGYSVPQYVAEGSYGAVWKSSRPMPSTVSAGEGHVDERQTVAIKIIRDIGSVDRMCKQSDRDTYLKRIYREIGIMTLFADCEEFVHILDTYLSPDGKDLFIVMPFIDHSLTSVLGDPRVRNIGLPEDLTRYIAMQLLVALSRMEKCNCIHRDLSLSNVLVQGEAYEIFLADFGLSRAHYEPGYDMTNVDIVTLPYRPPEIALRGQRLSNKIDIWSLGIILVECLTGKPLLHGAKDDLMHLQAIVEKVDRPKELDDRVQAMMSEPGFRWLARSWGHISLMTPDVARLIDRPVSAECMDVIRGMLRFHPDDRMSASELLGMPWFVNAGEDAEVMHSLLSNPKAPQVGLSSEFEASTYEQMLTDIHERCSGSLPTQRMELAYVGKHYDR
jgi:serine/threonine protein kinase